MDRRGDSAPGGGIRQAAEKGNSYPNKTIKAEDGRGIKGGPRKDYLSDVSLKLRYKFRLFRWRAEVDLSVFNLLDFGSELSEDVFSGGLRHANELQIPRSFRLGLSVEF